MNTREPFICRAVAGLRMGLALVGALTVGVILSAAWYAAEPQAKAYAGGDPSEAVSLTQGTRLRLMRLTFEAVAQVESRMGRDPRSWKQLPTGELGPLQMKPERVADVNRILGGEVFTLADRMDLERCWEMFQVSCDHYWRAGGPEQWARHWNGSPTRGPSQRATAAYWAKVRAAMEDLGHG